MRFSIEGVTGVSELNHNTLTIIPGKIYPVKGITIIKKY